MAAISAILLLRLILVLRRRSGQAEEALMMCDRLDLVIVEQAPPHPALGPVSLPHGGLGRSASPLVRNSQEHGSDHDGQKQSRT